ncbi:hypothetical protein [Kribbella sp. NPDC023855]|uniref:hypothetical protein n=1 Tax=Kribbella sp. NPDC023855 TaxID=3154698 RepID=UPI0033E1992D
MRAPISRPFSKLAIPLTAAVVTGAGVLGLQGDAVHATRQEAAAASCTLNVPATISISTPAITPAVTVGADCAAAGVVFAQWDARREDGTVAHQYLSRWNKPDVQWNVFDDTALGLRTWLPAGATTGPDPALAKAGQTEATVPQNTPKTDIRLKATGQLVSWSFVEGCKTTFNVFATRYAARWDGYVKYPGATAGLQARPPDHSSIIYADYATTDSEGKASMTINNSGPDLEWRVWISDAYGLTWAASSAWKPVNDPC